MHGLAKLPVDARRRVACSVEHYNTVRHLAANRGIVGHIPRQGDGRIAGPPLPAHRCAYRPTAPTTEAETEGSECSSNPSR